MSKFHFHKIKICIWISNGNKIYEDFKFFHSGFLFHFYGNFRSQYKGPCFCKKEITASIWFTIRSIGSSLALMIWLCARFRNAFKSDFANLPAIFKLSGNHSFVLKNYLFAVLVSKLSNFDYFFLANFSVYFCRICSRRFSICIFATLDGRFTGRPDKRLILARSAENDSGLRVTCLPSPSWSPRCHLLLRFTLRL